MRWIIFVLIYLFIDWHAFQALRTITKNQWIYYLHFLISVLVVGNVIVQFLWFNEANGGLSHAKSYAIGFLLTIMALKLAVIPFLLGEDIVRVGAGVYHKFFGSEKEFYMPARRRFVSQMALGVAAIPFLSLLYGMYKGKYDFRVLKYTLTYDDLPEAFDGYRITQISDIHSGSFDNREKIEYAVDLINEQQSDIIVFTGDMVNNKSDEMKPWLETFSRLTASDGKFSVLGNHDYGDYVSWSTQTEKHNNLLTLMQMQKEMGFDLLLNEHRYLNRGGHRLALVGVENWGVGGFKKAGDFNKAISGISADDFTILLSHDPSHWEHEIMSHQKHVHLTMSGHTHGMQFGIEIPGWIKWSPVKWRYKYWAGIYKEMGQYINVNRGFGFLAYPGRVGIWPEITVIELKRAEKVA